jgi:hypothetical protein
MEKTTTGLQNSAHYTPLRPPQGLLRVGFFDKLCLIKWTYLVPKLQFGNSIALAPNLRDRIPGNWSFKRQVCSQTEFGNKIAQKPAHKSPQGGIWPGIFLKSFIMAVLIISNVFGQSDNASKSIWISRQEIMALPVAGKAWQNVKREADRYTGKPNLSDQNDPVNVRVMAKALVFARTGTQKYRDEVIEACMAAIDTEYGGRTLALGRELIAYVIAADLVGLPAEKDKTFRAWLRRTLTEKLDGTTLVETHERRPNNWGTHAGASRAAVAAYLGDQATLDRVAKVFKGWLGDRASYAGFEFGDLSWQADSKKPAGINPKGAKRGSFSLDGVLPDDQRRAGGFRYPFPRENYVYGALAGALAQAIILHRAGYDVWNWQDRALLRAFRWLHTEAKFPAKGDDTWEPHVVNYYYDTDFPAPIPARPGKNVGWTDWTHGKKGREDVKNSGSQ